MAKRKTSKKSIKRSAATTSTATCGALRAAFGS